MLSGYGWRPTGTFSEVIITLWQSASVSPSFPLGQKHLLNLGLFFHILSALFPSWQLFFLAQMLFWAQGNSQLSRSLLKPCSAKSTLRIPSVMRCRTTFLSSWQEVGRAFSSRIPSFLSSPLGYWRSQMHLINLKLAPAWSAVQLLP